MSFLSTAKAIRAGLQIQYYQYVKSSYPQASSLSPSGKAALGKQLAVGSQSLTSVARAQWVAQNPDSGYMNLGHLGSNEAALLYVIDEVVKEATPHAPIWDLRHENDEPILHTFDFRDFLDAVGRPHHNRAVFVPGVTTNTQHGALLFLGNRGVGMPFEGGEFDQMSTEELFLFAAHDLFHLMLDTEKSAALVKMSGMLLVALDQMTTIEGDEKLMPLANGLADASLVRGSEPHPLPKLAESFVNGVTASLMVSDRQKAEMSRWILAQLSAYFPYARDAKEVFANEYRRNS